MYLEITNRDPISTSVTICLLFLLEGDLMGTIVSLEMASTGWYWKDVMGRCGTF